MTSSRRDPLGAKGIGELPMVDVGGGGGRCGVSLACDRCPCAQGADQDRRSDCVAEPVRRATWHSAIADSRKTDACGVSWAACKETNSPSGYPRAQRTTQCFGPFRCYRRRDLPQNHQVDFASWRTPAAPIPIQRMPAVLGPIKAKPFGWPRKSRPALTGPARDGCEVQRSGRKNARGAGRTEELPDSGPEGWAVCC